MAKFTVRAVRATAPRGPYSVVNVAGYPVATFPDRFGADHHCAMLNNAPAPLTDREARMLAALKAVLAYEDDRPGEGTRGAEVYAEADAIVAEMEGRADA